MRKIFIFLSLAAILVMMPFAVLAQSTNTVPEDKNINSDEFVTTSITTNALDTNVNATNLTTTDPILESDINSIVEDPGTLPGSTFYFLKTWGEGIRLFFTFDENKKTELDYMYTLRRYAEIQKLIAQGKTDLAEKQLAKAELKTERLRNRIETTTETNNGVDKEELVAKLEAIQARHQEVMMRVYEQVPEQAKDSILRALDNSSAGLENAIEHVSGSVAAEQFTERVQNRIENQSEDIKLEVKARLEEIRNRNSNNQSDEDTEPEDVTNTNSLSNANSNINSVTNSIESDDVNTDSTDAQNNNRRINSSNNNSNENELENN